MSKPLAIVLQVVGMALAWFGLFELNGWVFGFLDSVHVINWVFLPAAVRLLGVMLLGWRGAAGLFIGTLATNGTTFAASFGASLAVASLSALVPLLAVHLTMRILRIPLTLHGLTPGRLAMFAVIGALCNVVPHNFFFWLIGLVADPLSGLVPMFIGDLLGTIIVLYVLRALLLFLERQARPIAR